VTRAEFCVQCAKRGKKVPLPPGCAANTKYCRTCSRSRYLESKRVYQSAWRSRARAERYDEMRYDPTEAQQRAAAAFSADYSRVILNPEQGGDNE
jgi:hypothetical protein